MKKCLYARSRTIVLNTSRDLIFPCCWRIFGHVSALDQSCASDNIWWITRSDIWASVCWRQCTKKTNKHRIQAKKFWKMELHREPRSPPARSREIKVSSKKSTLLSWGDWKSLSLYHHQFNPVMIQIILSADVHPHRGPNSKQKQNSWPRQDPKENHSTACAIGQHANSKLTVFLELRSRKTVRFSRNR